MILYSFGYDHFKKDFLFFNIEFSQTLKKIKKVDLNKYTHSEPSACDLRVIFSPSWGVAASGSPFFSFHANFFFISLYLLYIYDQTCVFYKRLQQKHEHGVSSKPKAPCIKRKISEEHSFSVLDTGSTDVKIVYRIIEKYFSSLWLSRVLEDSTKLV